MPSRTPRWGPRVAAAAYAFFVTMLGTTLPTPLYRLYQQQLGFSPLVQTTVFATYAVGVIAALVLAGSASDRHGRRPVLFVGLALAAVSAIVFASSVSLPALFAGRLLSGLSAGLFTGTATTTLVELAPAEQSRRASFVATAANILGLGTGPLLAAVIAAASPYPLLLPYLVHLALLVPAAVLLMRVPETVRTPVEARRPWRVLRPTVPREVRAPFAPAAAAGFAGFATLGLFTAIEPRLLSDVLGIPSLVAGAAVVSLVFVASVAGQATTLSVPSRTALPLGCALLVLGMGALVAALEVVSLGLLLLACVLLGAGQGTSFRAGVAGVAAASPEQRRSEVSSTLFVVFYVGISLPVIGVGALSQASGLAVATVVFAGFVSLLAIIGGLVGRESGDRPPGLRGLRRAAGRWWPPRSPRKARRPPPAT